MESGVGKWAMLGVLALIIVVLLPIIVVLSQDESQANMACRPTPGSSAEDEQTVRTREDIPEEYLEALESAAADSGFSVELLAAQIDAESSWDPQAGSPRGAQGLSQFMPETWREYGDGGDPFDPYDSIAAQGRYMGSLIEQIDHLATSERELAELALAAYNAGPGAVLDAGGIPEIAETQNYVRDIMAAAQSNYSSDCRPIGGHEIGDLGSAEWTHPLPGGRLTSGFGWRGCFAGVECNERVANHGGLDFSTGGGATVVAPFDIQITQTSVNQYQGEFVMGRMTADPSLVVQFHHCQSGSTTVAVGDTVAVGTPLCTEGSTGNSQAPHLHFQLNTADAPDDRPTYEHAVDPQPLLLEKGVL